MYCPVCKCSDLIEVGPHKYWADEMIYCCGDCTHSFINPEHYFSMLGQEYKTNKFRAKLYVDLIQSLNIKSIVEIGPSRDLYLLQKLHKIKQNITEYFYDLTTWESPPYINYHSLKEEDPSVDLILALHVIEHISDLYNFLSVVKKFATHFIIETPN